MSSSILGYVPLVGRLLPRNEEGVITLEPVEVHNVETDAAKRPRTLKHLLRANHVNYSIVYHNLQFDNHMPHLLCSAYLLGANVSQLHHIYAVESVALEAWKESPDELTEADWRDFLGNKHYQRAYVDFFEDRLALKFEYDWKKVVNEYMFHGKEPLVNGLIGGLGHPLIHLGYAYEMNSKEIAMEALGLAAVQYNYFHKYLDDPSYTQPSAHSTTSLVDLLDRVRADTRFDDLFETPGFENIDALLDRHEGLVVEYWNAWKLCDPVKQFQESQEAAVNLLVATVPPGTHAYNFFVVHLLTTSHAVRILLPFIPAKFHVSLVREWWLLTLAVYIAELRPRVDPDYIPGTGLRTWGYVEQKALTSRWATDAHFVKGKRFVHDKLLRSCCTRWLLWSRHSQLAAIRAMREISRTWGDVHERVLAAALRFVDDFEGWVH